MINSIVTWLQNLIASIGPLGVGIATCIESFFAPIPSEVILITAGTIAQSNFELLLFLIFATLGSYIGTLPFYFIGRKSRSFVYTFFEKYGKYLFVSTKDIEFAESKFENYGKPIIFFGRLLPIIRSLVSIPAGICRVDLKTYTIYTLLGSFTWNTILIGLGYIFKDYVEVITDYLDKYEKITLALIIVLGIIYAFFYIKKNIRK